MTDPEREVRVLRADMAQVLIERPRGGMRSMGYRQQRRRKDQEPLDARRREGIGRREHGHDKYFSDLFGPLIRYLRANVGRPWDVVYREICTANDLRNPAARHLRHHVFDFVSVNVTEEQGRLFAATDWGRYELRRRGPRSFYVCPRTKLLRCAADQDRRRKGERNRICESRELQFHRSKGRWYEVVLRDLPASCAGCFDALLGKPASDVCTKQAIATYGRAAYALSVRPVTREQGRRLSRRAR